MSDRLTVGVIGTGEMGQKHCNVYSRLRSTQLVGVSDTNEETGQKIANQYEVPYYYDPIELLHVANAVSLVTPTNTHYDLAMLCMINGVNLLLEKPITETLAQAELLVEMAEKGNHIVQIGHIERYNQAYLELKRIIEDVKPLTMNLRRLSPYEGSNLDVDVVLDLMIHDIDLIIDIMQCEPIFVTAFGLTAFSGSIDHAKAQLTFESGQLVTLEASRVTQQKVRSIEIIAEEAFIEADLLNKSVLVHRRTIGEYLGGISNKYRQESIVERIHVPIIEPLIAELDDFTSRVTKKKSPQVTARDGMIALKWANIIQDQIYQNLLTPAKISK